MKDNWMSETKLPAPQRKRLLENLARIREAIADAARRTGRAPNEVRLVGVTKYVPIPVIAELLAAGVHDLGENRVQQLTARAAVLGRSLDSAFSPLRDADSATAAASPPAPPRWHMIGHLQRNKVRALLPCSRTLHSVDSLRLAEELERCAAARGELLDVFLEVNVAGEASKSGIDAGELDALAGAVGRLPHLQVRGLMTMAPIADQPEASRPHFARLRMLLEALRRSGGASPAAVHLSMGMSQDYVVAVEEGATFVRVGSVLFEGLPPAAST